jgi:prepilin-type N-terminal cleavage/methylation domain-containing protein
MKRVGNRTSPANAPASRDRVSKGHRAGFTLVELLTVIAISAVLATLMASTLGAARKRSQEAVCRGNLRQIAIATEVYQDETGRRPRSYTRLTTRPSWIGNARALVCPADPALRKNGSGTATNSPEAAFWGNRVNGSQEPQVTRIGNPEESSWDAEIRETTESVAFSYLHPLGWRRDAWQRLVQGGNQSGVSACELHGMRIPGPVKRPYAEFEGQTLRVQRDLAVVNRRIFRTPAADHVPGPVGDTSVAFPVQGDNPISVSDDGDDYPWEFYIDGLPARRR